MEAAGRREQEQGQEEEEELEEELEEWEIKEWEEVQEEHEGGQAEQENGQAEKGQEEKGEKQDRKLDPEAAAADMKKKLRRITTWLKKIYEDEPIPDYEVNTQTVDVLYELAECSEARDRDVSLLIEDMKQKATEYEAEAKYFQDVLLETLDISLASLSREGTDNLNILVDSAMTLETKDTSLASFFCAITDMSSELYATELKNRKMEVELRSLRTKLTKALMLEKQLKEDLKNVKDLLEVEAARADSELENVEFLKKKSEHLELEIKDAEEELAARGLDQTLTHGSLVSLSKEVALMQDEVVPLKKELDSYLDLTPNSYFVDIKIEEVKKELDAAEAEFSRQIDKLSLELPKPGKIFP